MSNLLASLVTSADGLRAFERALSVIQNNVTNASTPGYVRQRQSLEARLFEPELGFAGGVTAGDMLSSRNIYVEQAVRQEQERYGRWSQRADDLGQIEPIFDIRDDTGIPSTLDQFFQAASVLSVSPNNVAARQVLIDCARQIAASFNQTAQALASAAQSSQRQIEGAVSAINRLTAEIRDANIERRRYFRNSNDAGLDAQLHAALEELSEYVDLNVLYQPDGSVTVLFGGETPLVMGDRQYELTADFSEGQARILGFDGQDVTAQAHRGRISALLEMKNSLLPSYISDLDRLASSVADRVNETLAGGVDADGIVPSLSLFTYDPAGGAALTMGVSSISPAQIAAALPDAPGGNGNALRLAALAGSREIDGVTFVEFYGMVAARVGRELSVSLEGRQTESQLLEQARTLRQEISGVSLDEEAARVLEFQRSYQAIAKLLAMLNDLSGEVLNFIR